MAQVELKTGFIYWIYPTSEEAKQTDFHAEGGSESYGFHGTDVSPLNNVDYEWFADGNGDNPQKTAF